MKSKALIKTPAANPLLILLLVAVASFASRSWGQAPSLLWRTNVGATLFAVDAQANAYANAGGKVIIINPQGNAVQTNSVCPLPGIARRDAAGNFYFAGGIQGTQDFGGIVLSNTPCFLTKYSPNGVLLWGRGFGPAWTRAADVKDFQLTPEGIAYVTYFFSFSTSSAQLGLVRFDSDGNQDWEASLPGNPSNGYADARVGGVTPTSCYALAINPSPGFVRLFKLGNDGMKSEVASWGLSFSTDSFKFAPVVNSVGELYNHEHDQLTKRNADGGIAWQQYLPESWYNWGTVAPDAWDGVFVTSTVGRLVRCDYDGNLAWILSLSSSTTDVITDSQGNRFVSLANRDILRLGPELTLSPPVITNAPQGLTVLAGDPATFSVEATGPTLRYWWLRNGEPVAGATSTSLQIPNAAVSNAGTYSVIVSNAFGMATNDPVELRVKLVQLFAGSQMLTNGTYGFTVPPTLTIQSRFANGSAFYTLDGSVPSFASQPYTAPFVVAGNRQVRAIGYSADFLQSEEADAVQVAALAGRQLSLTATGGGNVSAQPPGGIYFSNETVTLTATPAPGWSFLQWLGDAPGGVPSAAVTMDQDRAARAVFGTTLGTTVAGNGQVLMNPPGGVYPHGATVRLTAVPQPGNYFGQWGNAASGNTNPLYFTITAPTQTVSSIFGATPAGQAALTVLVDGLGRVTASPRSNAYALNQSVTVAAIPDAGQSFLHWSGDAGGSANPLVVNLNAAKQITAHFTAAHRLRVDTGLEGWQPEGFRFTMIGPPPSAWQILGSSNLVNWETLGSLSNLFGEAQFTDTNAAAFRERSYRAEPY